jgi:hypothetical protein
MIEDKEMMIEEENQVMMMIEKVETENIIKKNIFYTFIILIKQNCLQLIKFGINLLVIFQMN